jgi:hypothetical protein
MPHKIHSGVTYDSGDFMRVMDECLKLADWNGFRQTRRRIEEERQAARAAASAISSKRPRCSTTAW